MENWTSPLTYSYQLVKPTVTLGTNDSPKEVTKCCVLYLYLTVPLTHTKSIHVRA